MTTLLRTADRRRIPWKNGGGEAEDIATSPPDASWEAMDWRVSRAWITAAGPFSVFPGIDRTFLVAAGDGVELSPAGVPTRLDPTSPPFDFPGDAATGCRLLGGPVVAFNVMTARGRWRHRVERRSLAGPTRLVATADATVAALLHGTALPLQGADAVRLAAGETIELDAATDAVIAWVELWGPHA